MQHLRIENLQARYGNLQVLKGVSLGVAQGERLCLLGPSGCGKTTTLQVVAGFVEPESGRVWIGDQDVLGIPPEKRNIGVMFQNYALFPHLTVYENVAFGLRMRRTSEIEIKRRVADALNLVKLANAAAKPPRALSGGEQQRIAFARAIVIKPNLLLLDEPFSNLDARLRQEMRSELLDLLQNLDIATVMVTHDQEEAMAIADRIALMRAGRVEQLGTATEIYEEPASLFVAHFVGESNVFEGRVAEADSTAARIEAAVIGQLVGRANPKLGRGDRALVLVRPERMHVRPADIEPRQGWNSVSASVDRVLFLGHRIECHLSVGPQKIVVWQSSPLPAPIRAEAVALVEWAPHDTLTLPAEPVAGHA